jgi:hypothetical protein
VEANKVAKEQTLPLILSGDTVIFRELVSEGPMVSKSPRVSKSLTSGFLYLQLFLLFLIIVYFLLFYWKVSHFLA